MQVKANVEIRENNNKASVYVSIGFGFRRYEFKTREEAEKNKDECERMFREELKAAGWDI